MSELSPEARALLASLAPSHDPPPEAAARVRAAVDARVASPPPSPRRWPWHVGIGAAVVVAALALTRRPSPPPPAAPPPPARVAPPVAPPVAAPPPIAPAVVANDVPAAQAPVIAVRHPRRETPPDDDLSGELALLQRARRSLARGDGADALDAVESHARTYPRGRLTEEREAARVLAHCAAGRVDAARAAAERFVARYPSSPQVDRVRGACAR